MANHYDRKVLVGALMACDTRELMEDAFHRFEEDDKQVRIDCLNECMGNPKTFFSCGENNLILDDIYEMTVQMFLTGAWKTAMLYRGLRG